LPTTVVTWLAHPICSDSCGRNTQSPIRDTSPGTHSPCVWRLSLQYVYARQLWPHGKLTYIQQVCWGPLSYVTAYMITVQHPYRFPIQAIVSLGQIYGLILYYATSLFDLYYKDISYSRPEPYFFWFYFFFVNFIWMVIPGCKRTPFQTAGYRLTVLDLLYQSVARTGDAFRALDRMSKSLAGSGAINASGKKQHTNGGTKTPKKNA
jgi:hypothetical protein